MRVNIEDIKNKACELDVVEDAGAFAEFVSLIEAGEVRFIEPVSSKIKLSRVGAMYEVEGSSSTMLRLECGRCLCEFDVPLSVEYSLTYVRELPSVETDEDGELLSAEDMGLTLLEGDEIDIADAIQEQVLMSIPMRPLCSQGCKGLCQHCGTDLNQGACGCSKPSINIKFAALKDYKVDRK